MSRIGKNLNNVDSGDYNSNDFKGYGDGISTEYIIAINDLAFGSIVNDSRTRALTKKTNCTIEVTPRILNKRVNLYRWVKYAIIKISGPDEASLNQCLRLLEKHFPIFLQRKEYTRRANVTIFTNDLNMPDNIPGCNPIMRSASTMSSCQGLLVKSPFEVGGNRILNQLPWKISKPEISGRYFQTHLCENASQPSLPHYVSSRNLDSNSKLFSGSLELDEKKINKNKLFGSMGTLTDSNNPNDPQNFYAGGGLNRDAKSSQTYDGNLISKSSPDNIRLEREALLKGSFDDRLLAEEYANKNRMIANINKRSVPDPLNPNAFYGAVDSENKPQQYPIRHSMSIFQQGGLDSSSVQIRTNIDYRPNTDNICINPFSEKQSDLQPSLNKKSAGESRPNIMRQNFNKTLTKSVPTHNEMKNQKNLQKNIVTNRVSENVSRKNQQYQVLNSTQDFPKTTNLESIRNQQSNPMPITHSSLHSLDSLSNSPTHSKTVSHGEITSMSRKNNQGKEIYSDPNKCDTASAKVRLSFTSSSGMCNFVTNIIMMNIPASEVVHSSQVIDNKFTASNTYPLVSIPSRVMSETEKSESKDISHIEQKTSSVRGVDEWVCLPKDTTFPVYTSSRSIVAAEPEKMSYINEEPLINSHQSRESQNFRHSPKVIEIRTSIVSGGISRDSQIKLNETDFEPLRYSTSSKDRMSPSRSESHINVQPVSGLSRNISYSATKKDSPNGFYVNGINRASQRSQDTRNPVINFREKKDIINSISEKLKNPKDGTLIIMFEGSDIYCTGQMTLAYKPVDSKDNLANSEHRGGDNFKILFESTEYFVTAESRGIGGPKNEQIKTCHVPPNESCLKPK